MSHEEVLRIASERRILVLSLLATGLRPVRVAEHLGISKQRLYVLIRRATPAERDAVRVRRRVRCSHCGRMVGLTPTGRLSL